MTVKKHNILSLQLKNLLKFVCTVFLVFCSFTLFFTSHVNAETNPQSQAASELVFTWPLEEASLNVVKYSLQINGQTYLERIPNRPTQTSVYNLEINSGQQSYSLKARLLLAPATYNWQIIGTDAQDSIIVQTVPQPITVQENNQLGFASHLLDAAQRNKLLERTGSQILESVLLLLTGLVAIVYSLTFIIQFSQILTIGAFAQVLEALGLVKISNPQGMVFDAQTYEPIPYALITVEGLNPIVEGEDRKFYDTLVTEGNGLYRGVRLPNGLYRFKVKKDGYAFPSLRKRSPSSTINDYYQGEIISVNSNIFSQQLMIPMDSLEKAIVNTRDQNQSLFRNRINFFTRRIRKSFTKIMAIMWAICLVTTVLRPALMNYILLGIYSVFILFNIFKSLRQPLISGTCVDADDQPLAGAIVRLTEITSNQLVSAVQTDDKGRYKFYVKPDHYQLNVFKNNYTWDRNFVDKAAFSLLEIDATQRVSPIKISMSQMTQTVDDFFAN